MQSANHVTNINLFFSVYSVFADSHIYSVNINVANTTNRTHGIDISAWYYWDNDDSAIADIYFTDIQ